MLIDLECKASVVNEMGYEERMNTAIPSLAAFYLMV